MAKGSSKSMSSGSGGRLKVPGKAEPEDDVEDLAKKRSPAEPAWSSSGVRVTEDAGGAFFCTVACATLSGPEVPKAGTGLSKETGLSAILTDFLCFFVSSFLGFILPRFNNSLLHCRGLHRTGGPGSRGNKGGIRRHSF